MLWALAEAEGEKASEELALVLEMVDEVEVVEAVDATDTKESVLACLWCD